MMAAKYTDENCAKLAKLYIKKIGTEATLDLYAEIIEGDYRNDKGEFDEDSHLLDEEVRMPPERQAVADKFQCRVVQITDTMIAQAPNAYRELGACGGGGDWYFDGGDLWAVGENEWNEVQYQGGFEDKSTAADTMVAYIDRYLYMQKETKE